MHDPFFFTAEVFAAPPAAGDRIVLTGPDARHLAVVRRARPGDGVQVSDGCGWVVRGVVTDAAPAAVGLEARDARLVPRPAPAVTVVQGLAKAEKVELVVQKLVELGVDRVVVFAAGRSVPRWDEPKRAQMLERWRTVAREAAKQSRRAWLPVVEGPLSGDAVTGRLAEAGGTVLVADETSAVPLREALPAVPASGVAVVVGPEGGLTAGERAAFAAGGAIPCSLGPQVLRTETAALAAAAVVLHRAGRLG